MKASNVHSSQTSSLVTHLLQIQWRCYQDHASTSRSINRRISNSSLWVLLTTRVSHSEATLSKDTKPQEWSQSITLVRQRLWTAWTLAVLNKETSMSAKVWGCFRASLCSILRKIWPVASLNSKINAPIWIINNNLIHRDKLLLSKEDHWQQTT